MKCGRIGVAALLGGYCVATVSGCIVIEGNFPPPNPTAPTSTTWSMSSPSTGALKRGAVPDRLPRDIQPTVSLPAEPQPVESQDSGNGIQVARYQAARTSHKIEPRDVLSIDVTGTLPKQPISGKFTVSPDGTVNLGFAYGTVRVGGLTLEQVQAALGVHLEDILQSAHITVGLAQAHGLQQARGENLLPGGFITGKNDDGGVYFLIIDWGGDLGKQVYRCPYNGNVVVLDAIATIQGLTPSKRSIWLVRPSPDHAGRDQVLPVDWKAITERGDSATNYEIRRGDRIYVSASWMGRFEERLMQLWAPVERIFGGTWR